MQVKLCFEEVGSCNPLRRSCVSRARNAGKVAFSSGIVQPSIARVEGAECR